MYEQTYYLIGLRVGFLVGLRVGVLDVGFVVGFLGVGLKVGLKVGLGVGLNVGSSVGFNHTRSNKAFEKIKRREDEQIIQVRRFVNGKRVMRVRKINIQDSFVTRNLPLEWAARPQSLVPVVRTSQG